MSLSISPLGNDFDYSNYNATQRDISDKTNSGNCSSCSSRTYVCSSGGSMQISPESSFAVVAAHENEHVAQATSKAQGEGREVISSSTRLFMDSCGECGTSYVSGGEATTMTGKKSGGTQMGALHQPGQLLDLLA